MMRACTVLIATVIWLLPTSGQNPVFQSEIRIVEIALVGASAGRHTHPGEEISYILEGQADILVDGQPVQHVKAGDSFVIPNGAIHDAHNTGTVPLRLVGIYLVDKSKPMATPAMEIETH